VHAHRDISNRREDRRKMIIKSQAQCMSHTISIGRSSKINDSL
jgi:hypothetical protein